MIDSQDSNQQYGSTGSDNVLALSTQLAITLTNDGTAYWWFKKRFLRPTQLQFWEMIQKCEYILKFLKLRFHV